MKQDTEKTEKKIFLATPRGFCAGVKNAIEKVEKLLRNSQRAVFVRHEIVHNKHVINELKQKGVKFVENLSEVPYGSQIVFSAHGVPKSVEKKAIKRGLIIHDATCPIVKKIHKLAQEYSKLSYTLILIGHKDHPEIIGTAGRINGKYIIVEKPSDINSIKIAKNEKFICLTQTTLTPEETKKIYKSIRKKLRKKLAPLRDNICYATKQRQDAVKKIAKKCDMFIIIGSNNSSNSKRLKEIAERFGCKAILIEDARTLNKSYLKSVKNIGISSGASAPEKLVKELIKKLQNWGWTLNKSN